MNLVEILKPSLLWPRLKSKNKAEMLRELAGKISAEVPAITTSKLVQILEEREKLGSTGIQDGIAIPHGKVPELEQILVACGISQEGIDFESHDGKPTNIFFVLLAPEYAAGQHLKVLARLSRILKHAEFRNKLFASNTSEEMLKTILDEDKKS